MAVAWVADARNWPLGRSSPRPATPSSPCHPFAIQALRQHRRQQLRLRLALGQAPTLRLRWVEPGQSLRPVELDLVFRNERGTPVNPNHASRAFARLAGVIEGVFGPGARGGRAVSVGRRAEGTWSETQPSNPT